MPKLRLFGPALLLFALNAYICHRWFFSEYTNQTGSIDAAFMGFAQWLSKHWSSNWIPLWMSGTTVRQIYNPVLHRTVAAMSMALGWTAPRAYHFLTGITYCLGPVTLYSVCARAGGNAVWGFCAGVFYSLYSPSLWLASGILHDAGGGLFFPRRFEALARYGEGPHVTAVTMIPIVIWLVDGAVVQRKWQFVALAPLGVATLLLTNWTGTTGLMFAVIAYVLAQLGAQSSLHWPSLIGTGAIAYMLASPWIPLSLVRSVQAGSHFIEETKASSTEKLAVVAALVVVLVLLHLAFQHWRVPVWPRFFGYLFVTAGGTTLAKLWFQIAIVPIAHRFQIEMELGLAGALAYAVVALFQRAPKTLRWAAALLALFPVIGQVRHYHREADNMTARIDFSKTAEYRMSKWFADHADGARVFAPGTVSYWMNLLSETPQVYGCCDQSVDTEGLRIADYVIYTGDGTGDKDGATAILWLKAFGAKYVGVGEKSQIGQPYWNPKKFEGLLDDVWHDGESVVYALPGSGSLAHVVDRMSLLTATPSSGIDTAGLATLTAGFDQPTATLQWSDSDNFETSSMTGPDQVVYVQESYKPGWRAFDGQHELPVMLDPLGFMWVAPQAPGEHRIRWSYGASTEDKLTRTAQLTGIALLLWWTFAQKKSAARNDT